MTMKEIKDTYSESQYKFEKIGQVLEGYYHGHIIKKVNGKDTQEHKFITKDGRTLLPLGTKDLNDKLSRSVVGYFTRIEFVSTKKLTGQPQPLKVYFVNQNDEDVDNSTPQPNKPSGHTASSIKQQKVLS